MFKHCKSPKPQTALYIGLFHKCTIPLQVYPPGMKLHVLANQERMIQGLSNQCHHKPRQFVPLRELPVAQWSLQKWYQSRSWNGLQLKFVKRMTSTTNKFTLHATARMVNRSRERWTQILPLSLYVDLKYVDDVYRRCSSAVLGVGQCRCLEFRYLHGAAQQCK